MLNRSASKFEISSDLIRSSSIRLIQHSNRKRHNPSNKTERVFTYPAQNERVAMPMQNDAWWAFHGSINCLFFLCEIRSEKKTNDINPAFLNFFIIFHAFLSIFFEFHPDAILLYSFSYCLQNKNWKRNNAKPVLIWKGCF